MKKEDGTFIVGIDLGTTYSLVATVDAGRPEIIPNTLGELLTPSAVAVDEAGQILVGAAARAYAERAPERAALSFKRDMGTDEVRRLGGQSFTAVELSALVLKALKSDAEAALGGPVSEAVITVPAYFGDEQRTATREAASLAGLICQRLINEPTGAALAHGFEHREGDERLAVLDLGGGTFDVTLLELTDGIIEIRSTAGDTRLGGDDFTDAVAELIRSRVKQDGLRIDRRQAWEPAERVKRLLTAASEAHFALAGDDGALMAQGKLTRTEAEHAWAPLIGRMTTPIERALRDAGWAPKSFSRVLLVGGAARMPVVRALAERIFEQPPVMAVRPDETVALGAAVQAALMISDESVADLVATDIAPFSLGIRVSTAVAGRYVHGLYAPILERGTVLPATRSQVFHPVHPQQTGIDVVIYQGEQPVAERNTLLGELKVRGLRPGKVSGVAVRFTYDLNGILEVEAKPLESGDTVRTVIDRSRGHLSDEERKRTLERFERLKVDPRELLPNRVALERAESAYARALGDERTAIGEALLVFRVALEDGRDVDAARAALNALLRHLDAPRAE
ncbi:MAG: Hsp70 family protein [Myxococcales bacterium]|nr:Hsp70 family protein [Myxococcales bacterium]